MSILIKSAKIIDADNYNGKVLDIYIVNGIIKEIGKNIINLPKHIISKENLHISAGWFDSSVCFGEPGFEEEKI